MEKNLTIMISVNNVPLGDLENIHEKIEEILETYAEKRIVINMQDEPVVFPR